MGQLAGRTWQCCLAPDQPGCHARKATAKKGSTRDSAAAGVMDNLPGAGCTGLLLRLLKALPYFCLLYTSDAADE